MRVVTFIRGSELSVAIASTYMVAVTMIQTSIYAMLKPYALTVLGPIMMLLGADVQYVDIVILGLVLGLSFNFWRRGDEAGFGRLFSLNMLMFFPSVLDFSTFNWVNLILPYEPSPAVGSLWVFGVGLLLQATYLALRYTVRFRMARDEFFERGADPEDIDDVSRGQMGYLAALVLGTVVVSVTVYYLAPIVTGMVSTEALGIPYLHVVVGAACTLLIAGATVLYLRDGGAQTAPAVQ
jgi:hypothetical protein